MSLFLNHGTRKPKNGKAYSFWQVKETYWDPEIKASRQRFVAYVGKEKVLTQSKAQEICEKKGITMEQLGKVKGLAIVPDEQPDLISD